MLNDPVYVNKFNLMFDVPSPELRDGMNILVSGPEADASRMVRQLFRNPYTNPIHPERLFYCDTVAVDEEVTLPPNVIAFRKLGKGGLDLSSRDCLFGGKTFHWGQINAALYVMQYFLESVSAFSLEKLNYFTKHFHDPSDTVRLFLNAKTHIGVSMLSNSETLLIPVDYKEMAELYFVMLNVFCQGFDTLQPLDTMPENEEVLLRREARPMTDSPNMWTTAVRRNSRCYTYGLTTEHIEYHGFIGWIRIKR